MSLERSDFEALVRAGASSVEDEPMTRAVADRIAADALAVGQYTGKRTAFDVDERDER